MNGDECASNVSQSEQMAAGRLNSSQKRLEDIFQPVPPRALVLIIGHPRAGKSSFIECLIGELARRDRDNPCYFHTLKDDVGILKLTSPPKQPAGSDLIEVVFVLTASVFKKRELNFCEEMRKHGKPVVLLRTKIDNDLRGEQRSRPKSYNEREVLNEIRINCENKLSEAAVTERVYLLDNTDEKKYDFPLLLKRLSKDLPLGVRESLNIVSPSDQSAKLYSNGVDHITP